MSDEYGRIEKRFAYDPWGNRAQLLDTHEGTGGAITRGFTDHEHLDDFGLIHMNGRIFDPVLARYLSADPIVQDSGDSQTYNRYSYCGNNPLNATDPSGYLTLDDVLRVVVVAVFVAVAIYVTGGAAAAAGWGTFGTTVAVGAAAGFTAGFIGTLAYGGGLSAALKAGIIGGAIGAATAALSYGIGTSFAMKEGIWANSYVNWTGRTLSHAVVGGLSESAQGGQFRHGFYASAFSNGIMHIKGMEGFMGGTNGGWQVAARTATAALIGGTAAQLSGGKFVNGAATSAIQHLMNFEETKKWSDKDQTNATPHDGTQGNSAITKAESAKFGALKSISDTNPNIKSLLDTITGEVNDTLNVPISLANSLLDSIGMPSWLGRFSSDPFSLYSSKTLFGYELTTDYGKFSFSGATLNAGGSGVTFQPVVKFASTPVNKNSFIYTAYRPNMLISMGLSYGAGRQHAFYKAYRSSYGFKDINTTNLTVGFQW